MGPMTTMLCKPYLMHAERKPAVISGPIPHGSPIVRAIGHRFEVFRAVNESDECFISVFQNSDYFKAQDFLIQIDIPYPDFDPQTNFDVK